eukprot:Gregarina_sp_Poly_1__11443@NODE_979_length_5480_cov_217_286902_g691_i0_p1_GENE_NODE_979_length_5480_cov_217_286902_g691_i0NODE_979_length_5480_cov_217_286902_g691_i0_p1_ORF_typecomplete_len467_score69_98UDPGT/PF00201_18/5_5e31Glyco_tran_28_C/PF04101_16/0_022Glyco_transf_28/PF03033_20/0_034_NODE_979_length_5480_cov_217_286902_g691_i038775277
MTDSAPTHILISVLPAAGHINPAIQLALYLVRPASWKPHTVVTLFAITSPEIDDKVKFPQHPHIRCITRNGGSLFGWIERMIEDCDNLAQTVVEELSHGKTDWPPVSAVVYDFMSAFGCLAAERLRVPSFAFMASPMFCLYSLMSLPELHRLRTQTPPATEFVIPGIGAFPMGPKPTPTQEEWTASFVKIATFAAAQYAKSQGCLANDIQSFYSEEFFEAFKREKCPAKWEIFCCGPLALVDQRLTDDGEDSIIQFMNRFPPSSVLFIALGSCWSLKSRDLVELAHGVALSQRPFIFAFRGNDTSESLRILIGEDPPAEEPTEADGLPLGFRESVKGRGLVVPWCNQLRVLQHPSYGAFLTHCGWNSAMEGVALGGRPLLLLPIGGDQFGNAHFLAEVLKCGDLMWSIGPERSLCRDRVCAQISSVFRDDKLLNQTMKLKAMISREVSEDGVSNLNTMAFFHSITQ